MTTTKKIDDLIIKCRNSSFNKNNYSVNLDLSTFAHSVLLHTWYDKKELAQTNIANDNKQHNVEWLNYVTPEFQRDNNKWNKAMKLKFIENLLCGVKVELMFFRMERYQDAKLIDGLQRTTAILDFFHGKIKPFGFSYSELKNNLERFPNHNLLIKIYTFNTWQEVGKFYIDMNENITHSKKDIEKAKDFFLEKHGIALWNQ